MNITEYLGSTRSTRNGIASGEHIPASTTSSSDADFFTSQLLSPRREMTSPSSTSSILSIASSELIHTTDQLKRTLKAISKKGNDEQLGKFPNQLSNALFQSQILVKSLGKTTQCIDKICNLQ